LDEIATWEQANRRLANRYFKGVNPPMPDFEAHLAWLG